jgi:ABC-type multidrug transport system ATPase subunit
MFSLGGRSLGKVAAGQELGGVVPLAEQDAVRREAGNEASTTGRDGSARQSIPAGTPRASAPHALSGAAAGHTTELAFIRCSYTLAVTRKGKPVPPLASKLCRVKTTERKLLSDVSATVAGGRVLAVMGPSGAGKTTMLNMLTLERGKGKATGYITLNGHPLTPALYAKHCAVVTQQDTLWTFLTCRDHLHNAISLYRPSLGKAEREKAIDDLLDATGLTSCQHTKAGNIFFRGLSGGQKRRLSLACALAKKPSVIFLDEPTSGLDSAAAAKIMALLKTIARNIGIAVVCTIHQPSFSVFEGFDDTLILSGGRIAYFGPASDLSSHLERIGRPVPANANPAEYALDVVNSDFTSKRAVRAILEAWPAHAAEPEPREPRPLADMPPTASFAAQTAVLLRRHAGLTFREPVLYTARLLMIFLTNLFFAVVWVKTRDYTQEVALQKFFMMAFCVGVPALYTIIAVYGLNVEVAAVRKEIKDGMYSPNAYVLANFLLQVPAVFLLAAAALLPPWVVCDIAWSSFAPSLLAFGTLLMALECCAQALSLIHNPLLGMMLFITHWFMAFLFSGVFVRISSVIWPLRLLCFATPMRWGLPTLIYQLYTDSKDFAGAEPCTPTPQLGAFCPGGFFCPGESVLTCYGKTGEQVLNTVGINFDVISAEFTLWRDLRNMALIALVWKLLFVAVLKHKCASGTTPSKPGPPPPLRSRHGAHATVGPSSAVKSSHPPGLKKAQSRPGSRLAFDEANLNATGGAGRSARTSQGHTPAISIGGSESRGSADIEDGTMDIRTTGVNGEEVTHLKTLDLSHVWIHREAKAWKLQHERDSQEVRTELAFIECNYSLTVGANGKPVNPLMSRCKTSQKMLLRKVSASVSAGHVLAVMGPSGAGKTTLLNMLTLEPGIGDATGYLTLNGHPLTPALYAKHCAVVTQQDLLWTFLTCREHLRNAISLYRPSLGKAEREKAIDDLLDATGLTSCQHTKAGNIFFRGLSGGQKRRLSLACALAKKPSVIFLDEPTSGLDSAAAAKIMKFMKEVAMQAQIAIVCTIHQPSFSVFEGFDDTLILSGGRIAYFGPASDLSSHLERIDRPLPPNANPAEYALDVVNADFTSAELVSEVLDAWPKYAPPVYLREPAYLEERESAAGFCVQVAWLLKRHGTLMLREPMLYTARMVLITLVTLFFCVVYYDSRLRVQEQVMQKAFFVFWLVCVPVSFPVIVVYALNAEYTTVRKEIKDGMYGPLAYALANSLLQLPMMFAFGVCALVPSYLMLQWPWVTFATTLVVFSAHAWTFECIAQFFSLTANPLIGMLQYLNVWFISALFSGLVFRGPDVIWPIRVLYYCLPMKWFFSATAYSIMGNTPSYEGTVPCQPRPERGVCVSGFECPADPFGLACFGKNGTQILDSLGANYDAVSSENTVLADLVIILAIGIIFKLSYLVYLYAGCTSGSEPELPRQMSI